jgi:hypothetical protein
MQAHPLPCILPARLAALLPDLEELEVRCFDLNEVMLGRGLHETGDEEMFTQVADLQPIPYCSSLRKIGFAAFTPYLPSKYHTSEDLRRQLPNVVSLELQILHGIRKGRNFFETVLDAWGSQLTQLYLHYDEDIAQLQQCTSLQLLHWRRHSICSLDLPRFLTTLELMSGITEPKLQAVLQLPALHVFEFYMFLGDLQHDWSNHSCSWQRLKIHTLRMIYLSKLPLHSLNGERCLMVEVSCC